MIQLIAYEQSTETPYYLDIDSDEDISLNFSVSEIKDFSTRKSSSSNSFTLPFTNANNQFFAGLYNVNLATGTFDIYQKTNCQLLVDSLTQIQGYLYIESINLTTETYSVVIIGETGNLIDELGEKKLQDLDDTWQNTFTHALTYDNIVNSWDDNITYTGGATDKSVIKYPFINWGINNKIWTLGGNNTNDIIETTGAIVEEEFKPAMKVATIFDRVFAEAGYSYDSQFFSTSGFNIYDTYLTLAPQHSVVRYRLTNQGVKAIQSSDQKIATNAAYDMPFDNDSTGGAYDSNGNFNTGTYSYTCPKAGTYAFKISAVIEFTRNDGSGDTSADYRFSFAVDGVSYNTTPYYNITNAVDGGTTTETRVFFFNVNADAGNVVKMQIDANAPVNPNTLFLKANSFIQLTKQPNTPVGESIYVQDNMPDESQIDFLKSFFEHFNMFVEPKQDNPKELIIDPYPIYMDRGVELDWTEKIDLSKEVQIIPTTNFRKSKLIWNWKEDKNYLDTYRRDFSKKPYGGFEYEDKSDLTEGEFKNKTIFSAPTNRLINISGTTQIYELCVMDLTARQSDGSVAVLKGNPRIFFFKKKDLGSSNNIRLYDEATTSYNQIDYYGYAGHYSDVPATTGTFNLNWSDTYSGIYNFDVWVTEGTENNPFTLYWKKYLNEIYSDEARMLVGYFNLNSTDIHNLRFNNKIFVKDAFYRINSISGYKPNNTQPCKVELIKLGSGTAGLGNRCDLLIDSFNADGTVTFANAETGSSTDPTKDCCEAYGYTWIQGEPSYCYWKAPADNGDPFAPQDLTAPE